MWCARRLLHNPTPLPLFSAIKENGSSQPGTSTEAGTTMSFSSSKSSAVCSGVGAAASPARGGSAGGASGGEAISPGWVAVADPTSGATYWYHSETRQTTWDQPAAARKHQQRDNLGDNLHDSDGSEETRVAWAQALHVVRSGAKVVVPILHVVRDTAVTAVALPLSRTMRYSRNEMTVEMVLYLRVAPILLCVGVSPRARTTHFYDVERGNTLGCFGGRRTATALAEVSHFLPCWSARAGIVGEVVNPAKTI